MRKMNPKKMCSLLLAFSMAVTPAAATETEWVKGDINGDGVLEIGDAMALFQHSILPEQFPVAYGGNLDLNKDGMVDINDATLLFQHSMLPEMFPIEWGKQEVTFSKIDPKEAFDAVEVPLSFNSTTLCSSALDAKGEGADVSYTAWWSTSDMILNDCYGLYYNLSAHKLLMSVAFFDGDGNYISGVGTNSMNNYATSVAGFVVRPENAVSARFLYFEGTYVIPKFNHSAVFRFETKEAYDAARALYPYEGLKIACLGDSLTEGDYGPITDYGGRRFENYPYYLGQLTGATTVNFGRCGASSTSYLNDHYNKGDIDVSGFDVILLMLGTNKGLAFDSQYYTDYCTLVDKILAEKKPEAKLILITPPSATTDFRKINYGYMDNVTSANEAVIAIAKEKGLVCFDALKMSPIQPEKENLYQSFDGLHMNARGYEAFAKYIAQELSKILD